MYSTIQGAKKRANALHKLFRACGFEFPLYKSQYAIARAGGFRDWQDLTSALKAAGRDCAPAAFRRRLIEALPEPCRAPTRAWLDGEPMDSVVVPGVPAGWYRYVFPYQFATAAMHRHSSAIRRGSGPGQRLRENMVPGVLLNIHGGRRPFPRLEPDTLALVFDGTPEMVFDHDSHHPRFAMELQVLQDAGVIKLRHNQVMILSPDREEIRDRVLSDRIDKVVQWAGEEGHLTDAIDALRDALSVIGIDDALRVAEALLQYGSSAYVHRSGPIQDILSDLAATGQIQAFARFYQLATTIWPPDARLLLDMVPAKILNQYFAGYLGFAGTRPLFRFTADNPDWADELRLALPIPVKFERTVFGMAELIRRAA